MAAGTAYARVIATGTSTVTGQRFNLAVAVEGEPFDGGVMGRAVAVSTFHHFADLNWDVERGAPSFVTDKPGDEMKRDPARLEIFKDYVRNIARWLGVRPTIRGPLLRLNRQVIGVDRVVAGSDPAVRVCANDPEVRPIDDDQPTRSARNLL